MALTRYHDAKTNQTELSIKGYVASKNIHVRVHFICWIITYLLGNKLNIQAPYES